MQYVQSAKCKRTGKYFGCFSHRIHKLTGGIFAFTSEKWLFVEKKKERHWHRKVYDLREISHELKVGPEGLRGQLNLGPAPRIGSVNKEHGVIFEIRLEIGWLG
jgi:hypothetical protein